LTCLATLRCLCDIIIISVLLSYLTPCTICYPSPWTFFIPPFPPLFDRTIVIFIYQKKKRNHHHHHHHHHRHRHQHHATGVPCYLLIVYIFWFCSLWFCFVIAYFIVDTNYFVAPSSFLQTFGFACCSFLFILDLDFFVLFLIFYPFYFSDFSTILGGWLLEA